MKHFSLSEKMSLSPSYYRQRVVDLLLRYVASSPSSTLLPHETTSERDPYLPEVEVQIRTSEDGITLSFLHPRNETCNVYGLVEDTFHHLRGVLCSRLCHPEYVFRQDDSIGCDLLLLFGKHWAFVSMLMTEEGGGPCCDSLRISLRKGLHPVIPDKGVLSELVPVEFQCVLRPPHSASVRCRRYALYNREALEQIMVELKELHTEEECMLLVCSCCGKLNLM